MAGQDTESQEVSMLALHLLQSALVHVNTLLMQQDLADPKWGRQPHRRGPAGAVTAVLDAREPLRPVRNGHEPAPRPGPGPDRPCRRRARAARP
ncbi:Tn3 family transposase [Streptomyces sp. B21-097]|uniref:Tn3 family transposase n=1 Tax=Streptomyces sp. B21-097 TaxID=3039414 RepID=UPI00211A4764